MMQPCWKQGFFMRLSAVLFGLALSCALSLQAAWAEEAPPPFDAWLDGVRQEAREKGIVEETIRVALTGIEPVRRVVQRDRNQSEFKLTFQIYRDRLLTPTNIRVGRGKLESNRELLDAIAAEYGVQSRFILAIWGMETRYGAVKPTMPVVPAVATLAYDRRRSSYFRRELFQALLMIDRGYISHGEMLGSWAGAMGQPQFMPSSYMAYARDHDGDGRRDIWTNEADVFASIANYLAKHGWHDDQTWGREVRLPDAAAFRAAIPPARSGSGCRAIDNMSGAIGLTEWQELGVRRADGTDLPTRNLPASLVEPDGPGGKAFLVYRNYHSILRYNCAHLYGLAVSQLADAIGSR